ncbi:MAG TPA: DUF3592 domain-containing protein [Casimicrobiaceae bacterium]|nr:DUF3592 domain-containing protein [Casimicrobiaceae bacterium]
MNWMFMLVLGIGVLALLSGALMAVMRVRTIYFGAKAEGRVVGHSESTSSSSSRSSTKFTTLYAPIVEFTFNGKKYKFTSSLATQDRLAEGSKVLVRFLPDQPDLSAEIGTGVRMWGFPIMALVVGSIFILVALYGAGYLGVKPP